MPADDPSLLRQWNLIRMLASRRHGLTVAEMTQELGVNDKTIRRDLERFQRIGFPLEVDLEEYGRKRWRIRNDWNQTDSNFSFDEILALYLGRRFLEPLAGTMFWQGARRAIQKIRSSLNEDTLCYLDRLAGQFYQTAGGAGDYSSKFDLVDELWRGVSKRRAVFITYRSQNSTESLSYDIHPYGMVYHRGSLYLVGFSCQHDELRHWKVDRVEDAEVTEVPFEPQQGFNLQRHLLGCFGVFKGDKPVKVRVRFSARVARYVIESTWHPSQKIENDGDGSVVAEFQLSDSEEIKHWILGFGAEAVVLAPQTLRDEIVEELDRAIQQNLDLTSNSNTSTTSR